MASLVRVRLDADDALVIADELASLGDDVAATGIILAVERLRAAGMSQARPRLPEHERRTD